MKSHLLRLTLLGTVLSAFTFNIALAGDVATDEIEAGNITVSFDDLNLAKPAGVDSLHNRVESAARKLCGVESFRVSLDLVRKNRECVSATIDSALGKVEGTSLTAVNQVTLTTVQGS
jgi:UrcA family protein